MNLVEFMSDKKDLWNSIVERNGLVKTDLFRLAPWSYADTVFRRKWDNMISMVKAYQFGFTEMIDSEEMMKNIIQDFRRTGSFHSFSLKLPEGDPTAGLSTQSGVDRRLSFRCKPISIDRTANDLPEAICELDRRT